MHQNHNQITNQSAFLPNLATLLFHVPKPSIHLFTNANRNIYLLVQLRQSNPQIPTTSHDKGNQGSNPAIEIREQIRSTRPYRKMTLAVGSGPCSSSDLSNDSTCPTNKKQYYSREQAQYSLTLIKKRGPKQRKPRRRQERRVYQCPLCSLFHLTSTTRRD